MIQETTLDSYRKLKQEGKIQTRERQLFLLLKGYGNKTDRQMAIFLNLPINSITPRRNELVKKGLVEEKGKRFDLVTNRTVILWGVK